MSNTYVGINEMLVKHKASIVKLSLWEVANRGKIYVLLWEVLQAVKENHIKKTGRKRLLQEVSRGSSTR